VPKGKRLSVCHVTPGYFADDSCIGGGERFPSSLAQGMAAHADVTFVSFGKKRKSFVDKGVRIELYPLADPRVTFSQEVFAISESLADKDVIHCHQYYTLPTAVAARFGRVTGTPVFVSDHGGPDGRARRILAECTEDFAGILADSQYSLRDMPATIPNVIVFGGVDPEFFTVTKAAADPRIVYIGRIVPHKGIDVLIEAMPPGVPLEIHGRPYHADYLERLKRLAEGKPVEFRHNSTDADLRDALSRATALVLPSVYHDCYGGYHPSAELLGLVLLEALATGTPVICTAVGGMPEIVTEGKTAFIVPPSDPADLRRRLEQLVADPALATSIGAAGRQDVTERFTWDAAARRCLDGYVTLGAISTPRN
jgi:glycosyltransferase involved in cell wall biosynthesis